MPENLKTANVHLHATGTRPDLRTIKPRDIHFEDIRYNLCRIPRFTGNTSRPYTVGEHSVLVMQIVEDMKLDVPVIYQAFCHDFPEYLTGDISAPVKACVPEIREFEHSLWLPICEKFHIPVEMDAAVKHADWVALFVEAISLCPSAKVREWENWNLYGEEALAWVQRFGQIDGSNTPPTRLIEQIFTGCFGMLWDQINRG